MYLDMYAFYLYKSLRWISPLINAWIASLPSAPSALSALYPQRGPEFPRGKIELPLLKKKFSANLWLLLNLDIHIQPQNSFYNPNSRVPERSHHWAGMMTDRVPLGICGILHCILTHCTHLSAAWSRTANRSKALSWLIAGALLAGWWQFHAFSRKCLAVELLANDFQFSLV